MKKITKTVIAAMATTLIGTSLMASSVLSQEKLDGYKVKYSKLLASPTLTIKKGIDQGKFTQLEVEARTPRGPQRFNVFFVNGVEEAVFFGKAYSPEGKPFKIPMNIKSIKAGVAFTMGEGKEDIYVVSDPDCPWCKKLEVGITPEAKAKYRVNMIPMPLAMHKNAKPVMYWVMSGKDNSEQAKRMHDYMSGADTKSWLNLKLSPNEKSVLDKRLADSLTAAIELGASGTPAIYDKDMNKMSFQALTEPTVKVKK